VVRSSGTQTYNDADLVGGNYQIGTINPMVDFCSTSYLNAYSTGDAHELDVAGSGPVFFWSKRNGNVDATCVDTTYNYSGGSPGVGVIEQDSTPTAYAGAWSGGSLPAFSSSPSDNFARANSGWLGDNWWMVTGFSFTGAGYFSLSSDAAILNTASNNVESAAIWTTPLAANHSSTVTIGTIASSSYWIGAVARYTVQSGASPGTFYIALYTGGNVDLFAESGGAFTSLASAAYGSTPGTIELDATGSAPVSLTVKADGTSLITFSDSTYEYTGTYAGFAAFGSSGSTVTGWSGANL
jgi:hypothetical protein